MAAAGTMAATGADINSSASLALMGPDQARHCGQQALSLCVCLIDHIGAVGSLQVGRCKLAAPALMQWRLGGSLLAGSVGAMAALRALPSLGVRASVVEKLAEAASGAVRWFFGSRRLLTA